MQSQPCRVHREKPAFIVRYLNCIGLDSFCRGFFEAIRVASCRKQSASNLSNQSLGAIHVTHIRPFQNGDLPALARVWVEHWSAVDESPMVSPAIIEQAVLSRTFFQTSNLLIAENDGSVEGWVQYLADPLDKLTALIGILCFSSQGLQSCDLLLRAAESEIREQGFQSILVGPLRDNVFGYAGLSPLGHGIGIPATDARTASLLSRNAYTPERSVARLTAMTNPYRMPVSRESLQLRRSTRVQTEHWFPADPRQASAMAHLDIESYSLVNHRTSDLLATVNLWFSDPEAQVMNCAKTILDLNEIHHRGSIEPAESFLIGTVIQSLANRRVFSVETAVDSQHTQLIEQLLCLHFQNVEQGQRWEKIFT